MGKRLRINPPHGDKTIKLTIAFFTDGISKKPGRKVKGECLDKGFVYAIANTSNGIAFTGAGRQHFNSSAELPLAVEKCLIKNGVKQHCDGRSRKYVVAKGK